MANEVHTGIISETKVDYTGSSPKRYDITAVIFLLCQYVTVKKTTRIAYYVYRMTPVKFLIEMNLHMKLYGDSIISYLKTLTFSKVYFSFSKTGN